MTARKKKQAKPMTEEEIIEMKKTQPCGVTKAEAPIISKADRPAFNEKGVVIPGYASPQAFFNADQVDVARAITMINPAKNPAIKELFKREPTLTDVSLAFLELFANCRIVLDDNVEVAMTKTGVWEFKYNAHLYVAQDWNVVGPKNFYNSLKPLPVSSVESMFLNSFYDVSGTVNFQYYGKMKARISTSTLNLVNCEHRFSRFDGSFDDITREYDALLYAQYEPDNIDSELNEALRLYAKSLAVAYEQKLGGGVVKVHFAINNRDEEESWKLRVRYCDLMNSDGRYAGTEVV